VRIPTASTVDARPVGIGVGMGNRDERRPGCEWYLMSNDVLQLWQLPDYYISLV
jgi:hypothetical protein